jgi:hypothetical protein
MILMYGAVMYNRGMQAQRRAVIAEAIEIQDRNEILRVQNLSLDEKLERTEMKYAKVLERLKKKKDDK